jgi:septal ring factor EnvC (AmiA/AmiB activator)
MTEIKIGKAVLKIDMHIPNSQGHLSYQAANEIEKEFEKLHDLILHQEDEIERLNAYIKELRMEHMETDKMLKMDTSALHKKD